MVEPPDLSPITAADSPPTGPGGAAAPDPAARADGVPAPPGRLDGSHTAAIVAVAYSDIQHGYRRMKVTGCERRGDATRIATIVADLSSTETQR